jgi:hypothetical protein
LNARQSPDTLTMRIASMTTTLMHAEHSTRKGYSIPKSILK